MRTRKSVNIGREGRMRPVPEKCEDINTVRSFCDCISGEESVDVAAEAFCKRVESGGRVTGDDLVELKKALKDLEETDSGECCCDC
jgi:hypothetical protein